MKKTECLLSILIMLFVATPALRAQESASKHALGVEWSMYAPVGDGNFLNRTSWIAPAVSYEYRMLPLLSLGLSVGYMRADESGMTHDRFNGDVVDGSSSRSLTMIPVQLGIYCFPWGDRTALQPYAGVSGGVNYADFRISGALIQTSAESNAGAVVTPQLGVRYRPLNDCGFYMDVQVYWQCAFNRFAPLESNRQRGAGIRMGTGFCF